MLSNVILGKLILLVLMAACLFQVSSAQEKEKVANPVVIMETSMGTITLELNREKAPVTVENFLSYANEGFYDGTIFHRVIENFMIQGGGFTPDMVQKETKPTIKNEAGNGLSNTRGTIAMARTQIVDSATAQFFINVVDNVSLDHKDESVGGFGYCVFGKVTDGMDVVDKIRKVKTGMKMGFNDVPVETVLIKKVTVKK
jgi:cyclophilin family peptidyl-prolyl cis-trans isomerase